MWTDPITSGRSAVPQSFIYTEAIVGSRPKSIHACYANVTYWIRDGNTSSCLVIHLSFCLGKHLTQMDPSYSGLEILAKVPQELSQRTFYLFFTVLKILYAQFCKIFAMKLKTCFSVLLWSQNSNQVFWKVYSDLGNFKKIWV